MLGAVALGSISGRCCSWFVWLVWLVPVPCLLLLLRLFPRLFLSCLGAVLGLLQAAPWGLIHSPFLPCSSRGLRLAVSSSLLGPRFLVSPFRSVPRCLGFLLPAAGWFGVLFRPAPPGRRSVLPCLPAPVPWFPPRASLLLSFMALPGARCSRCVRLSSAGSRFWFSSAVVGHLCPLILPVIVIFSVGSLPAGRQGR
jgi:hypothetical protein